VSGEGIRTSEATNYAPARPAYVFPSYLMSRKTSITSTPATSFTGTSRRYAIVLDQVTTGMLALKAHAITGLASVSLVNLRNFHCLDLLTLCLFQGNILPFPNSRRLCAQSIQPALFLFSFLLCARIFLFPVPRLARLIVTCSPNSKHNLPLPCVSVCFAIERISV